MNSFDQFIWRNFVRLIIAAVCIPSAIFIWIALKVIVLEPLGFFDVHVSEVPEAPHTCIKITEERYRYC